MIILAFLLALSANAAPRCYSWTDVQTKVCEALCIQDGYDTGNFNIRKKACLCGRVVEGIRFPIKIPSEPAEELSGGWYVRLMSELKP